MAMPGTTTPSLSQPTTHALPPPTLPPNKRDNTTPSCAVCQRRKVKCNRTYPCAPCLKTGLECSFRPVNQHRAKRRKVSQADDDDGPVLSAAATSPSSKHTVKRHNEALSPLLISHTARLVPCSGGYRYVNNHLWHTLPAQECHQTSPDHAAVNATSIPSACDTPMDGSQTHRSSESGYESVGRHDSNASSPHFILHQRQQAREIPQLAPGHVVQLWQVYLERVDPMMKVFHTPSVQQTVLGQIGKMEVRPSEYALVSAIYLISAVALTDSECQTMLQMTRSDALSQFRRATEEALAAAGFVTTTDFMVLQALVLYLAALRSLGDPATVWSMLGLTIRVAGTQGLARDGSFLNLSPFDAEMRRRLWWAIVYMDARTAELVGQDGDLLVQKHDVRPPSNLNDSDLFPSMSRIPDSKSTSTEMLYVQFRATLGAILRTLPSGLGAGGMFKRLENPSIPLLEKVDMLKMLEQRLDEEILRGCDPGIPLQLFTMNAVRTLLNKMRLVAHIPLTHTDETWSANSKFSEDVFRLSMSLIQLQLDLWKEPCLQRWRWHWQGQFQWFALACLIRQSRLRPPGDLTSKAWATTRNVFDTILPTLDLSAKKSPILAGIQSLLNAATTVQSIPIIRPVQNPVRGISPIPNTLAQIVEDGYPAGEANSAEVVTGEGCDDKSVLSAQLAHTGSVLNAKSTEFELGFDFDAIDWVEFDRLTNELCQQTGST